MFSFKINFPPTEPMKAMKADVDHEDVFSHHDNSL